MVRRSSDTASAGTASSVPSGPAARAVTADRQNVDRQLSLTPQEQSVAEISFDGRVAIVTGAGGGLGRTYALDMARRGAKVVVNDLGGSVDGQGGDDAAAQKVVDEIKSAGGEAVPNYDSVSTPEGGESIVKTAVDSFGKVDIVINNAGILRDKSFAKMTWDDLNAVIDVHLKGAFYVSQPAFKVMKENSYGRFVH